MSAPAAHHELLKKVGYPISPWAGLDTQERILITKIGYWLEGLATGAIEPTTDDQRHFLDVAKGTAEPRTDAERAWRKLTRTPSGPPTSHDLIRVLECLQRVRQQAAALEAEYAGQRAAIMKTIQPQLDEVDAVFLDRMQSTTTAVSQAERDAKEAVLASGRSFRHAGIYAMYARGRVTYDRKKLDEYAQRHPDVLAFRSVGKPTVSLRVLPSDAPVPEEPTDE